VGEILASATADFENALDDDLNVSAALGALFEARYALNAIAESEGLSPSDRKEILAVFEKLNQPLDILDLDEDSIPDSEIASLIEARVEARRNRDFRKSDEIRDQLLSRGIVLEDTRDGVRWKRR
jgi:cysteinyl-tRNA synthetase